MLVKGNMAWPPLACEARYIVTLTCELLAKKEIGSSV